MKVIMDISIKVIEDDGVLLFHTISGNEKVPYHKLSKAELRLLKKVVDANEKHNSPRERWKAGE